MRKEKRIKRYKEIRKAHKKGIPVEFLALKYGVTRQRIHQILKAVDNYLK